ncbi:low specificity L-threonine aldolase [Enterococcus gilvus]|jgi:threonine aldolase|uniref:threonine aldolase family protein n=1 Tax=Enterococcus gilvus TaxID=160453 RepID=UPI000DF5F6DD|nr:beta-eliminating lyase-related protein [Enterococcus gilvus]AXG38991.1 low specificity L-threonine aldolase [Enterococcus gilvus]
MLNFESDYLEGAHEQILQRMIETNNEKLSGYGRDKYSASAVEKIRQACLCPEADVQFIAGGTMTNALVIASLLKKIEGVIAAETGHITTHETGAIEFTGHKVLSLPQTDGKISAAQIRALLENFWRDDNREFMVFPGMVYLSHPTEYGTLYSKDELAAISGVCREYNIPLFLDGARLGYGLASPASDLTLPLIAEYCDVFYIGGTKVGALLGEAIVFTKNNLPEYFVAHMKQQGALLAKGRLLGLQFDTLFTDQLYFKISEHAIAMAMLLKQGLAEKQYRFYLDSPTNQQFIILENKQMEELKKSVAFSFWEAYDDSHTVIRFATSWATEEADVRALVALL